METSTAHRKKTETALTEIPDHLLAEIFIRLPAPEDLVRASTACVTFRRLVVDTDGSFLRRFRRLHHTPLLAFFDHDGFHHALPPHPSAPAARALAAAADFSFSFFHKFSQWTIADIRDGRILFHHRAEGKQPHVPMELAVCDPLHRKYVLLPPVPDGLAASVAHKDTVHSTWREAFLAPIYEEGEAAFDVIWVAHFHIRLAALVFSSRTGQWRAAASKAWSDLFFEHGESTMAPTIPFHQRHYAYGCFYWELTTMQKKELLVLDTRRMEFSISDLPPRELFQQGLAVVEAGEGRVGVFGILVETLSGKCDLCYYIKGNKCKSSSQWQLEKTVPLGFGFQFRIKTATGRYLLLQKYRVLLFLGSAQLRGCKTWNISQLMSRHCSWRRFVVNLLGFPMPGCGYIPTSLHRCLHQQYEVIPRSHSQIKISIIRAPKFLWFQQRGLLVDVAAWHTRRHYESTVTCSCLMPALFFLLCSRRLDLELGGCRVASVPWLLPQPTVLNF